MIVECSACGVKESEASDSIIHKTTQEVILPVVLVYIRYLCSHVRVTRAIL